MLRTFIHYVAQLCPDKHRIFQLQGTHSFSSSYMPADTTLSSTAHQYPLTVPITLHTMAKKATISASDPLHPHALPYEDKHRKDLTPLATC